MNKLIEIQFSGIGVDSTVDRLKYYKKYKKALCKVILMKLYKNLETILRYEIKKWLDTIEDTTGWVRGLGLNTKR